MKLLKSYCQISPLVASVSLAVLKRQRAQRVACRCDTAAVGLNFVNLHGDIGVGLINRQPGLKFKKASEIRRFIEHITVQNQGVAYS